MFVFVCWTPYQIFNAVNFVLHDVEGAKNNADIYIYHEFSNAEKISAVLKQLPIFLHVYDVKVYDRKKVWYSKWNKVKRLFFPYLTVKRYLQSDIDVRQQGYTTLIISGNNLFSVNLYNCISNLKVYFIDDGTGSYYGDMRSRDMTPLYKIFNRLFHRGPLSYKVEKIYMNNKACCQTTISENVVQLPRVKPGSEVIAALKKVFSYQQNCLYTDKKYIYFTQPLAETAIGDSAETVENAILTAVQDHVLVRVHPRQDKDAYADYTIDTVNNQWELECAEQITDAHVLIGAFSTAQFTPKMLYDKEPTVIFTYKLYGNGLAYADKTVAMLRNMYKEPQKVIVAESLSDLQQLLDEWRENASDAQ